MQIFSNPKLTLLSPTQFLSTSLSTPPLLSLPSKMSSRANEESKYRGKFLEHKELDARIRKSKFLFVKVV